MVLWLTMQKNLDLWNQRYMYVHSWKNLGGSNFEFLSCSGLITIFEVVRVCLLCCGGTLSASRRGVSKFYAGFTHLSNSFVSAGGSCGITDSPFSDRLSFSCQLQAKQLPILLLVASRSCPSRSCFFISLRFFLGFFLHLCLFLGSTRFFHPLPHLCLLCRYHLLTMPYFCLLCRYFIWRQGLQKVHKNSQKLEIGGKNAKLLRNTSNMCKLSSAQKSDSLIDALNV